MTALATLQARLESLKAKRDSGVKSLRHGELFVENMTWAEMQKSIAALEAEIATAQGTQRRRIKYIYQSGKGL